MHNTQANFLTLYQAIGPAQLATLIRTAWRCIEPGQGGERFIYLKCSQRYAEMIARQRFQRRDGAGYVVSLQLPADALADCALETVAYDEHLEYRVAAADLAALQQQLLQPVELVSVFRQHEGYSIAPGKAPPATLLAM